MIRGMMIGAAFAALPLGPSQADGGHTFRTCTEARAAGHSNIPRGGYGYGPHLDRDGDGIGCEG